MNSIPDKLSRIADKLPEARRRRCTGFGVDSHQFVLNPPMSRAELKAIEERFGLFLPEDYRAFLLQLGDGGAGPHYGVPSLMEALGGKAADARLLQKEFPVPYGPPAQGSEQWTYAADLKRGSILICSQGCDYEARLVLLGEARGRVVYVSRGDTAPPYFVRDATFLDWYERWLDDLLAEDLEPWFGFDNPDMESAPQQKRAESCGGLRAPIPAGIAFGGQLTRLRAAMEADESWRAPLPIEEIEALEAAHGVKLPEDYRAVVEHVSAGGGPGPFYGLLSIAEYALPPDDGLARLAAPFPLDVESALRKGCAGITLKEGESWPDGALILAHMGMSRYAFLAVSGAARGRVFYLDVERAKCVPYFVKDRNFIDWLERWLKEGRRDFWFGFDNEAYRSHIGSGHPPAVSWRPV